MSFLENDFINTNNKFSLSYYGNVNALGFKGTKEFIEKSYNLCSNYSITSGRLLFLEENFGYVLTDREKLYRGLKNYFIAELKYNKIVPLLKDGYIEDESEYIIEYNEPAIEILSEEKTKNFIEKYIIEDNFMAPIPHHETNNIFYNTLSYQYGNAAHRYNCQLSDGDFE